MTRIVIAALLALALARPLPAADDPAPGKQQPRKFEAEVKVKVELDYLLYLPKDYDGKKAWPLVLFLHGAGESGTDLEKVKVHGPPKLIAAGKDIPAIVVSPQSKRFGWDPTALHGLLDEVSAKYKVDADRVYVTGMSMGGMGTWAVATAKPERFAAIIPICGAGTPADAKKIKDLPIRIFQGAKDPVIRLNTAEAMLKALKDAGAKDVELKVYPDAAHDCWTETYANAKVWEWLFQQTRAGRAAPKNDPAPRK